VLFELRWTPEATRQYNDLKADPSHSDELKKIQRALGYLQINLRHPSLNAHQFHSLPNPYDPKGKVFEAYAESRTPEAFRVFWCYGPQRNQITIIAITPHP
jgi:hypothetical protein